MAVLQYIGARYVPMVYKNSDGSPEWRSGVEYEALTIVTYNSNSYTSRKPVPSTIGNPSDNPSYWAETGNYNAQLANVVNRMVTVEGEMNNLQAAIHWYTPEQFGATGDGTTDDSAAFQRMFDEIPTNSHILISGQYYKIDSQIVLNKQNTKIFALGKSDYNPALLSSVTDRSTLRVTAPGCGFFHMQIAGTDEAFQAQQDTQVAWEFDADNTVWNGNIDAFMFDCAAFQSYYGVRAAGRNLNMQNCMISNATFGVHFRQTALDTDNRGMIVSGCRFHNVTVAVMNDINNARSRHNVLVENNFCDITSTLYEGYSNHAVIQNNVVHAEHQTGGGFIAIKAGLYSSDTLRDIVQGNKLYGGTNTGNGIFANGAVHVDIKDNIIMGAKNHGIICTTGSVVTVSGNIINGCATNSGTNGITCVAGASGFCFNNVLINSGAISPGGVTAANNYGAA